MTVVIAYESAVSLIPFVGKAWASRGETLNLRHHLNWPTFSVISAVTSGGQPLFMVEEGSIDTEISGKFVLDLLRLIGAPGILVWDNYQSHHANRLRELGMATEGHLHLEFRPPYAPEPNPDEYV